MEVTSFSIEFFRVGRTEKCHSQRKKLRNPRTQMSSFLDAQSRGAQGSLCAGMTLCDFDKYRFPPTLSDFDEVGLCRIRRSYL
jgi:hypothetical protein